MKTLSATAIMGLALATGCGGDPTSPPGLALDGGSILDGAAVDGGAIDEA